jgi:dephospho-CoA kinase
MVYKIGITGGMASGKSLTAKLLRRLGMRVHDSDEAARRLSATIALPAIAHLCPDAVLPNPTNPEAIPAQARLDRGRLAAAVMRDSTLLPALEQLLHPLIAVDRAAWARRWPQHRQRWLVMEVPLLLETGLDRQCQRVMTMVAAPKLRQRRALQRGGMDAARWQKLVSRQASDGRRQRGSDFLLHSGLGKAVTFRQLRRALMRLNRKK